MTLHEFSMARHQPRRLTGRSGGARNEPPLLCIILTAACLQCRQRARSGFRPREAVKRTTGADQMEQNDMRAIIAIAAVATLAALLLGGLG